MRPSLRGVPTPVLIALVRQARREVRQRFPEYRRLLEALTSLMDARGRSGYPPPHSLQLSAGEWIALIARGEFPGLPRL